MQRHAGLRRSKLGKARAVPEVEQRIFRRATKHCELDPSPGSPRHTEQYDPGCGSIDSLITPKMAAVQRLLGHKVLKRIYNATNITSTVDHNVLGHTSF
ncbi:hypothetical protein NDU88_000441 [Pleurodeles waltl]|uniref:Uncharacterized protein n=1 Tax=Pleurodeles waltl TaxID=8319 RepID=A0AAV7L6H8_PLEWA|nr:hypothetical protein NDU88_000441 [Pleurodeles waltl]